MWNRTIFITFSMWSVCFAVVAVSHAEDLASSAVELRICEGQDPLEVRATISPVAFTTNNTEEAWEELATLRADKPHEAYPAEAFAAFLPDHAVRVGDTWKIDEAVIAFIRQLHAKATLRLQSIPNQAEGPWAILRSRSESLSEVAFRIHADFPMSLGRVTFSQFDGQLILNHQTGEVVFFRVFVPDAIINFDLAWDMLGIASEHGGYVNDMGRCRTVELVFGDAAKAGRISWTSALPADKSDVELAKKYYPAWQIEWMPLKEALQLSRQLRKPINVVSADGPFKDEAC